MVFSVSAGCGGRMKPAGACLSLSWVFWDEKAYGFRCGIRERSGAEGYSNSSGNKHETASRFSYQDIQLPSYQATKYWHNTADKLA